MKRLTVYYDGDCPLCRRSRALLEKLDGKGVLSYRDARLEPVQDRGILLVRMHVELGEVRYGGIDGVLLLTRALPMLRPFAPFVLLSILTGFGQPLYDFIARNRVVPVRCEENCSLSGNRGSS